MGTTPNYDNLRLLPLCPESWVWAEQDIRLLLRSLSSKDQMEYFLANFFYTK